MGRLKAELITRDQEILSKIAQDDLVYVRKAFCRVFYVGGYFVGPSLWGPSL